MELKFNVNELAIFKSEFENFYVVPKEVVEEKLRYLNRIKEHLLMSLTTFTNKLLQEWEKFLNVERKKL